MKRKIKLKFKSFDDDVVAALIEIRCALGLNQTEFAARIGKSQSAVARWENLKQVPSVSTLSQIAKKLNIKFRLEYENK